MANSSSSSRHQFLAQLDEGLDACRLDGVCLLAVSGGADSVAMLRGMLEVVDGKEVIVNVAHIDHQLRDDSADDSAWVESLCEELGVPCTLRSVDVRRLAAEQGLGIEEAARKARYSALEQIAVATSCSAICVAHHRDDQAETVLANLLRGSGVSGLRGMLSRRELSNDVSLVRPMLSISHETVLGYLEDIGQGFRTDETNADNKATRNRIRNKLIPQLRDEYNPAVVDTLCKTAKQAKDLEEIVDSIVLDLMKVVIKYQDKSTVRIDCSVLAETNRHVVRALFHRVWRDQQWPRQAMSFAAWDRLASLTVDVGAVTLPGKIYARRREQLLVISRSV
ncbi:MAG: tRNA lysidine(34) synthetase TilS [Planctomycetaceae bacterium]|nr:tRNA lysidine(34) synthetase TilS [Planctomycetaceae bacterium]